MVGDVVTAQAETYNYTCPWSVFMQVEEAFWILGDMDSMQVCPIGLFFNDTDEVCSCVRKEGVTVPTDGCESDLVLDIPYESHFDDVSCHKAKATEYGVGASLVNTTERGMMACFNGSSHFEVPFMQNWFAANNVRQFSVSFSMIKAVDSQDKQGVLNNADCLAESTFEVTNDLSGTYGLVTTDGSGTQETVSYYTEANRWYDIQLNYDGDKITMYIDSLEAYTTTATGDMSNNHVPLIIGNKCDDHYFQGCLDDIKIWNKVVKV